jgi:hypothetical protein
MERNLRAPLTAFVAALILSVFSAVQAGPGSNFDGEWRWCLDEIVDIPDDLFELHIPVGCELVDCCPECPGIEPTIYWRVRLEGLAFESASLKFDRLPKDIAARLKVSGSAQGTADNLLVARGEALISGLPVEIAGRAPVAQVQLKLDAAWLQARAKQAAGGDFGDAPDFGTLIIEQILGGFPVNAHQISFSFRRCGRVPTDRIYLQNNASGDSASVWVDANRGGTCVTEESHRGAGLIGVGNVLANAGCRSEVVVLSDDDAMQLVENVSAWTDLAGDTLDVDMTPDRLMAPVTVWLARPDALTTAQADFDTANLLYNTNNTGIGFAPTFVDVSADPLAIAAIGHDTLCLDLPRLLGSAYVTPDQLNVYYIDAVETGVNCSPDGSNIQFIGTAAGNTTLAHEFGHSMSLDHSDGRLHAPGPDIMDPLARGRTHFMDGQSFRMNAHCSSSLNVNGVRSGPVRRCDHTIEGGVTCPATTDTHCPRLQTDSVRH